MGFLTKLKNAILSLFGKGSKAEKKKERNVAKPSSALVVDWRAVSYNIPSDNMPRSVPWVHGVINDVWGPCPRIELAPKRRKGKIYPIHLILMHPNQVAAEKMGWDDYLDLTIDGHAVRAQKSKGPADGWIAPDSYGVWALVAELDADHPLVISAAEAAKPKQEAMDEAIKQFDLAAFEWSDKNCPHPDFMNEMRAVFRELWNFRPGYWPGDPLPDFDEVMEAAKKRLQG